MPGKLSKDQQRIIIAESFADAKAYKASHPEVADWQPVSVPTLEYRLAGRKLQDYRLTPAVAARPEAPLIERCARFLVALYGVADNAGDQVAHYEALRELVRPAPQDEGEQNDDRGIH
ncbi:hypothetical protein SEA_SCHMIDT_56 [Gordonia phage Schmidt]|uniref:Uncharacterized protein n=1 Tax=Gordonia phage Schmidt TaxID=2301697 RepID=A0A385E0A8_9CAUD|nr:hypothetical protein KDJ59_gp56 [Gordonia phage Schmidt]AXQ65176.1 hypothetical protein SEA_SCHMIDT_56 [Gordonia phage Schmidt]